MDFDMSVLFSSNTLIIMLAIFAVTYVLRLAFENLWHSLKTSTHWNSLVMPVIPILLGGLVCLLPNSLVPTMVVTITDKLLFGMVAGLFSGWSYNRVKDIFKNFGTKTEDTKTD
jgi:uncharacterized membrane protein YdjX (TVP38/TMEM64 family)